MKKLYLIALMLSLSFWIPLGAQETYTLKGQILAETGETLPGAFVMVNGKSGIGAAADAKGQFSLVVSPTDTIVVSMISYETKTIPLEGRKTVTVKLAASAEYLDQVVVIGYGEQRAKDVTGAISSVDMGMLETMPTHDLSTAMQGRVAGVVMSSADGQPGSEMNVLIRGANSVTQDNSPLYVIDGFPTEDFSMNSLNPEDIKSISILKDASAGAIYGARGANGVIIIETKGGVGDIKVEYSGHVAVHTVSKTMDVMKPYDYVKYLLDLNGSSTYITDETPLDYYKDVQGRDWQKEMFRPAFVHSHNLSVSGSTGKTRYSASGSYSSQDGVIHNTGYTRAQGRVKLEQDLFKTLTFKANVNYTHSKTTGAVASEAASSSSSWQSFLMYRLLSASPLKYDTFDDEEGDETVIDISQLNPVISAKNSYRQVATNYVYANASLVWKPITDLKLSAMYGYTANLSDTKVFNNTKTYSGFKNRFNNSGVNGHFGSDDRTGWVMELTANYKAKWQKKHVFSAMATFTMDGNRRSRYEYNAIQIPDEDLGISGLETGSPNKLKSYESQNRTVSALARVNYAYDSRYLFTVSFRADGSSKFPKGNRWGFFPSAAVGWRLKNESFLRNVRWIDDAKIRASWGITGNNRIGDNTYYTTIDYVDYYALGMGTPSSAAGVTSFANKYLGWEKTEQFDIGLDWAMFQDRVSLTLDLYRKTTRDLLLNAYVPFTTGVSTATLNVGSMRNQGLEITLNTVNIQKRNFSWSSSINISFNDSKVLSLANNQKQFTSNVAWTGDFSGTPLYLTRVGGPITQFYGLIWDGCYQLDDFNVSATGDYTLKSTVSDNGSPRENVKPGDIKYKDLNGDGTITMDDMTVIGRALPIFTGGFSNDFRIKNFSINIFLQYSCGNQIFNANRLALEGNYAGRGVNQLASYADRWSIDNQSSLNFRAGGFGPRGYYSTRTLEDGSYLRIKNVTLSYDFPKKLIKKAKINSLQLYLSGQNLYTFTKYSGADPEVSTFNTNLTPGFDYSSYPRNRIFTFGAKISFLGI